MNAVVSQTDSEAMAAETRTVLLRAAALPDGTVAAIYKALDSVVIVPDVMNRHRTGRLEFSDARAAEFALEQMTSADAVPLGAVRKS